MFKRISDNITESVFLEIPKNPYFKLSFSKKTTSSTDNKDRYIATAIPSELFINTYGNIPHNIPAAFVYFTVFSEAIVHKTTPPVKARIFVHMLENTALNANNTYSKVAPSSIFRGLASATMCAAINHVQQIHNLDKNEIVALEASGYIKGHNNQSIKPLVHYYTRTYGLQPLEEDPSFEEEVVMSATIDTIISKCNTRGGSNKRSRRSRNKRNRNKRNKRNRNRNIKCKTKRYYKYK